MILLSRFPSRIATLLLVCAVLVSASTAQETENASKPETTQDIEKGQSTVRGVIQAISKIEIRSDLSVPVIKAEFKNGMAFSKGDTLVAFDCSRFRAERAAASAAANAASIELKQKRTLLKYGATGKGDVELAGAAMSKSMAERDVIDQRMRDCVIKAPFDGRVVFSSISPLEIPKPGEPLLTIIDGSSLEVALVMPSPWLAKVKENSVFSITIDETGDVLKGTVTRFGAEVDPVSQTIEVVGKLQSATPSIRAGMSGSVTFETVGKDGI